MADDGSLELQRLIDRLSTGDEAARRELLDRACNRLRRLTAKMLGSSFPAVQARHDLDSVVHETWLRLWQALATAEPPTVADFFRLAAHKVRHVLLDLAERQRRMDGRERSHGPEAVQETYDPARLAGWSEFHERAAALPPEERAVFELHYYLDLPQAEVAQVLGLHPRKVSRLWIAATDRLADVFEG